MKLQAEEITSVDGVQVGKDGTGKVNSVRLGCQVNMGKMGIPVQLDVFKHLTAAEQTKFQGLWTRMTEIANKVIVTEELPEEPAQ